MDLRQYFRKIEELKTTMTDGYQMVVSLETPDGGKAGLVSEVSRANAAKLIAEGRAVLASEEQKQQLLEKQRLARETAKQAEMARQLQVTLVSEADLVKLQRRKLNLQ